jgi:hypothetical protein
MARQGERHGWRRIKKYQPKLVLIPPITGRTQTRTSPGDKGKTSCSLRVWICSFVDIVHRSHNQFEPKTGDPKGRRYSIN